jgi:molecular chaperone GrpE
MVLGDELNMAEEETEENPQPEGESCGPAPPAVQKAMDEKDKKIAELTDDLKRLQAEFENFKKRTEKEWGERVRSANQWIIADLLMVLDSFDKALEDTKDSSDANHLKDGVQMVHRQFKQILEREGLKEIDTKGKFDPFLHEAIMREDKEDVEDGKILEVYQKGYVLGGKTLRPAKVKVAKMAELEQPSAKMTGKTQEKAEEPDDEQYEIK